MTYVITTLLKRKQQVGKLNWSSLPSTSPSNTQNLCIQGRSYVSRRTGCVIKLAVHRRNCELKKKNIYIYIYKLLWISFHWTQKFKICWMLRQHNFHSKRFIFPLLVLGRRGRPHHSHTQPPTPSYALVCKTLLSQLRTEKDYGESWLRRRQLHSLWYTTSKCSPK